MNHSQQWLAELLEQLGDNAKAAQCYEEWMHIDELKDKPNVGEYPGLQRVREYCADAYHLAQLQVKLGKTDQAIETLKTTLERYNTFLRPDEQTYAEQLAGYSPDGSDIEVELARLYLAKRNFDSARDLAQKAVARIEKAIGAKSAVLTKPLETLGSALDGLGQSSAAQEAKRRIASLEAAPIDSEPDDAAQFTRCALRYTRQIVVTLPSPNKRSISWCRFTISKTCCTISIGDRSICFVRCKVSRDISPTMDDWLNQISCWIKFGRLLQCVSLHHWHSSLLM